MKHKTHLMALACAVANLPGVRAHRADVSGADIKALSDKLNSLRDDLAMKAEAMDKEAKRMGSVADSTKAEIDKVLAEQGATVARMQKLEQVIAELDKLPGKRESGIILPGAHFVQSASFKNFAAAGGVRAITGAHGTHARMEFEGNVAAMKALLSPRAATLTSSTSSAGDLLVPQYDGLVPPARRQFRIMDLIGVRRTSAQTINYVKETVNVNGAAPVSENPASSKPASTITYDASEATVKTIAHIIKASKQILDDVPQLQDEVNATMLYLLEYVLEEQILTGSGVGLNLNGIVTQATNYSDPGVNVQAESAIDRIRKAMLQVALANRTPDGIVLNPIDWTDMVLTKDSSNRYIFAQPQGMEGPVLWGLPVVDTAAMTANSFLVGAFRNGATYYDRESMNVAIATQNEDDFVKNLLTIRAETRGALVVKMTEAFVTGNFDGVESE